ncbi:peptidase family c78 domain-containing protein [Ditylenchus destructor]|uniref:Ufm1-specific protease n=1 Tax=Ditylenchus destructor TaxID=166010 RepID=A0AAD4NG05_9BILA|nr:peptidase family c78 domain-containing protein [Ditylenchus destructor]
MPSDKWKIRNIALFAQSYQNAVESYGNSAKLIGILFGTLEPNRVITNVVFVEVRETESLQSQIDDIISHLSIDQIWLGVAKFPNIEIGSLNLTEYQLNLKLPSPDDLNKRNFKKLFDANISSLIQDDSEFAASDNDQNTSIVRINIDVGIHRDKVDDELLQILNALESQNLPLGQNESLVIGNSTDSSTLEKYLREKNPDESENVNIKLNADSLLVSLEGGIRFSINLAIQVQKTVSDFNLRSLVREQTKRIFNQAKQILASKSYESVKSFRCDPFLLWPEWMNFIYVVMPSDVEDELISECKKEVRKKLNITSAWPTFLSTQAFGSGTSMEIPGLLINPHHHIKPSPKSQRLAIVLGRYQYHHYMQDNFDDSGWGCAYRSFQTVWSWFRLQHLTDKPIPTHKQIQQCLVDIGDKPASFAGSRQWIGSLELSFCLETMMGVSSRILSSKSGADIGEHARAIIFHFENYGAPIMIGGGQLAHTILGIDYNVRSGECRFLVLDPHYTGSENIDTIVKRAWCAWKPITFWDKKSFYNLMLPINPKVDI